MKKYDTYKECFILTHTSEFSNFFTSDWTFRDIESWMLDTYCIDKDSIIELRMSNVTRYKNSK